MAWKAIGGFLRPSLTFVGIGGFAIPDELFRVDFQFNETTAEFAEGWLWMRVNYLVLFESASGLELERHQSRWHRVYPSVYFQTLRIPYPLEFVSAYNASQFVEIALGTRFKLGTNVNTRWNARVWVFEGSGPTATQNLIADGGVY